MTVTSETPIRIVLVDASELVRRGITSVLASETTPPIHVVGEAGNGADGHTACLRFNPDVVLLEIQLPDGSGLETCRKIAKQLPDSRVVVLTSHSNDALVYDAVTSGAHGYLPKDIAPAALVQALRDVANGRSILDPDATSRVLRILRGRTSAANPADLSILSSQERRVLACVAEGMTNKQAGERLGLSENTVKNYLVNVFEKLKVKRRAQAAALFVQHAGGRR